MTNSVKFIINAAFIIAIGLVFVGELDRSKAVIEPSALSVSLIEPAAGDTEADRQAQLEEDVRAAKAKIEKLRAAYGNN